MKESGTITFMLNGQAVEIDFHRSPEYAPTTTLLNYLRSKADLQGTKEGCAEGDCGACTVMLIRSHPDGTYSFESCDSCLLFLPMLHGKAVITVENIGTPESLHPVQKAMVDHDGSQCGYCTPGFVMSLYTLLQNHSDPSQAVIEDALTGNLCRCTGYRSIVDAAKATRNDHPAIHQEEQLRIQEGLQAIPLHALAILGDKQKYFQPRKLDEALKLRSMYPQAVLVHGATDVALRVTKNSELLEEIIDLSALEEIQYLRHKNEGIRLGAGVSLERVKLECETKLPPLYNSLVVFGSLQIRNLATMGGNLASASPIGDMPPILMAYQAQVELASSSGSRILPLTEFITGYRQTALREDEIITGVNIPQPPEGVTVWWFKISKRKDLDISTVSAGFRLELTSDNKVNDLQLYYGGMAEKTKAAEKTQLYLLQKPWQREHIEQAMDLLTEDFTPISDARSGAEGRLLMARNLLLKFWTETRNGQ